MTLYNGGVAVELFVNARQETLHSLTIEYLIKNLRQ